MSTVNIFDTALLRHQAEERLPNDLPDVAGMSRNAIESIIHELRVHQLELEMQNEHLRETQTELELARERYVDLYEFAPVGYLTLSESGMILAANLSSAAMLRVERGKLLSQPLSHFVIPKDQEAYYLFWRNAFRHTQKQSCELRLQPGTGDVFYARLEAIQANEAGRTVCRLTLADITEQKQAEVSLRERERRRLQFDHLQRLCLALEAGDLGTWDEDLEKEQVLYSDRTAAMLGLASGVQATWKTIVDLVHPEERAVFVQQDEESRNPEGQRRLDVTFRIILPDEEQRWLRFVGQCIFTTHSRPRMIRRTGVFADVSAHKLAERLLHRRAAKLKTLVKQRTAGLQAALTELEYFSYTMVHDLRTPLRSMKGFGDVLLEQCTDLSPRHRDYLQRISAASHRMDQLIVDALDYSKVTRGHYEMVPIDSERLLREIIESYPQLSEPNARISVEGSLPPVLGNRALLTQCFSNLLTNAIKFVEPGKKPEVRISAQEEEQRVRIWFHDNGIGIPEEAQGRIFHMFERLSKEYEGTGIGLALVRKAAERMGGRAGVESQPGQGSRFWLELQKAERGQS